MDVEDPPPDPGGGGNENNIHNGTQNNLNEVKKINTFLDNLEYSIYDSGPFNVMVEHSDKNVGNLHPVEFGKVLYNSGIKGIKNIEKKGRNRVCVSFRLPKDANDFKKSDQIVKMGYKTFIPATLVSCKGVVKGVGSSMIEKEVIDRANEESGGMYKVAEVRRLNRRVQDKESLEIKYIPTGSYIFTFIGKNFPRKDHLVSEQLKNIEECEELTRQRRINEIMSFQNLSYFDAAKQLPRKNTDKVNDNPDIDRNRRNFPALPNKNPDNEIITVNQRSKTIHNNITPTKSYREVTKNKRRCPNSPGYDSVAHKECLMGSPLYPLSPIVNIRPINTNSSPKSNTGNSSPSQINVIDINELDLNEYLSDLSIPLDALITMSQTINGNLQKRGISPSLNANDNIEPNLSNNSQLEKKNTITESPVIMTEEEEW